MALIRFRPLFGLSPPFRFSQKRLLSEFRNIGFIGLGNMGSRMANNLIGAGYNLSVHDINMGALKIFSDKGASVKETPAELAESSDVVITMLPSSSNVINVYTGSKGLLHNESAKRPHIFIDSSTIDPQTSRKVSALVSNCLTTETKESREKPMMLDAPVSGGVLAAEAGTLTFMIGGPEEAYAAAKPIFLAMGKNIVYCGGPGNGSAAKICNNLALSVSMLGISEALALGQSLGMSATTLTKIFNSSSARCWSSDSYNPVPGVMGGVPSSQNYEGGFAAKLMAKDLSLASLSAKEVGFKCPLTSQAQEIFSKLCEDGHANKDFSCVFRHFYSGKDEHY
uniref:3-hydroxyisobutyrate dehydrogenase n=1 Tax=Kalanchoe fedtschenkoi TaxID=63787 RepID=A0A7N0T183_KALFE